MSSNSAQSMTLYHWSPNSRRRSIQREGLRRMSWRGAYLVTFATDFNHISDLKNHVADRHDVLTTQLDRWQLTVPREAVTYVSHGLYLIARDLPATACKLWGGLNNTKEGVK